jgi:magnesium transporter
MRVLDSIDEALLDECSERSEFFWLDLLDPSHEDLELLARRFDWHPLVLADMNGHRERPKLDRYGDQALLVFYGARREELAYPLLLEVHAVISGNWIITARNARSRAFEELRGRLRAAGDLHSDQYVVYRILDTLTDTFFPVMERIDDAIDQIEDAIVKEPTPAQLQRVFQLKRAITALRRVVHPQRDLAARAIEQINDLPGLRPGSRDYFRDVYDHLIRLSDQLDAYRDLLTTALDVYLSTQGNRLNAVMKRLTLVSTIFLPITALTGFFGMNFGWLVDRIHSGATFWLLGVGGAVASVVLLMLWFRRAHFLD